MLEKATERGYNSLEVAELVSFLRSRAGAGLCQAAEQKGQSQHCAGFQCTVAADVCVYLGDLAPMMGAAAAAAEPGWVLGGLLPCGLNHLFLGPAPCRLVFIFSC